MHPRDIDDFLVDRVFQPVVDRLPVAVETATGFISIGAAMASIAGLMLENVWWAAIIVPAWAAIVYKAHRHRPRSTLLPAERRFWEMRLFNLTICAAMVLMARLEPDAVTVLLIAGQGGHTAIHYMLACRQNPPPPKKVVLATLKAPG